ncbi:unnamed protein product [Colias eurytheme]|nr:unnamed protein product [Colias eurytheme]
MSSRKTRKNESYNEYIGGAVGQASSMSYRKNPRINRIVAAVANNEALLHNFGKTPSIQVLHSIPEVINDHCEKQPLLTNMQTSDNLMATDVTTLPELNRDLQRYPDNELMTVSGDSVLLTKSTLATDKNLECNLNP